VNGLTPKTLKFGLYQLKEQNLHDSFPADLSYTLSQNPLSYYTEANSIKKSSFILLILLASFTLASSAENSLAPSTVKLAQTKAIKPVKKAAINPIKSLLDQLYSAWNEHDIDKVMSYYSSDFITGDGIHKNDYKALTVQLWNDYPDIKIINKRRSIRNQDQYSTVATVDLFEGQSKEKYPELSTYGNLNALAQGHIFLKKYGSDWKINSDRMYFELMTVTYGNAKKYLDKHYIYFSAPEQVIAGDLYSGTLYFVGSEDVSLNAFISREFIEYIGDAPELEAEDNHAVTNNKLERLYQANGDGHNELISATALIYKGIVEPKLDGLVYLSKRVNILDLPKKKESSIIVEDSYANSKDD
jgi:hypothetical protein